MMQTSRRTRVTHISQVHTGTTIVLNGQDRLVASIDPIEGSWTADVTFTDGTTVRLADNLTVRR